jgi:hypothetical protein
MANYNFSIEEIRPMFGTPDLDIEDLIGSFLFRAHCTEYPDLVAKQDETVA